LDVDDDHQRQAGLQRIHSTPSMPLISSRCVSLQSQTSERNNALLL
jgi:hypothetical protein